MLIWLRHSKGADEGIQAGVGVRDDVLRGEDLATLVEVDAAYHALNERCAALLDEARVQADAMRAAAQTEADDLIDQAQMFYASAYQTGYEGGWQEALTAWHERNLQTQTGMRSIGQRQRERLAQLVALAVEQIVFSADPVMLFRQAATHVEGIIADGSPLKVRVHPDDLASASAAFDDILRTWRDAGRSVRLQVSGDAQLERGACVCEADLGAIDASLPQQLEAINAALARAVQGLPDDEDDMAARAPGEYGAQADAAVRVDAGVDIGAQVLHVDLPDEIEPRSDHAQTPAPDLNEDDFFADAVAAIDSSHDAGAVPEAGELNAA